MPGMLASLVARLRDKIQELERELTPRELKPYWSQLKQAELALYRPEEVHPDALEAIEAGLRRMLGVRKP